VSDEFGGLRGVLRHELTSLRLDVAIQEDFGSLGADRVCEHNGTDLLRRFIR
jgi:hypothetical protein